MTIKSTHGKRANRVSRKASNRAANVDTVTLDAFDYTILINDKDKSDKQAQQVREAIAKACTYRRMIKDTFPGFVEYMQTEVYAGKPEAANETFINGKAYELAKEIAQMTCYDWSEYNDIENFSPAEIRAVIFGFEIDKGKPKDTKSAILQAERKFINRRTALNMINKQLMTINAPNWFKDSPIFTDEAWNGEYNKLVAMIDMFNLLLDDEKHLTLEFDEEDTEEWELLFVDK
jgi:hypothetical protein